jgi:HPt (histidine-containing phosphotransfer) domain-containing protein
MEEYEFSSIVPDRCAIVRYWEGSEMQLPIEMRQAYLQRRKADLVLLEEACQKMEASYLQRIGHQLRGNALSYGFDELSTIGTQLEAASKINDFHEAEQLVKQIKNYVESYKF